MKELMRGQETFGLGRISSPKTSFLQRFFFKIESNIHVANFDTTVLTRRLNCLFQRKKNLFLVGQIYKRGW